MDSKLRDQLISAVYYSYKCLRQEESVQQAMNVPGATPEVMRQLADEIEAQSARNQGIEWGDVRSRAMDSAWVGALREAAKRMEVK